MSGWERQATATAVTTAPDAERVITFRRRLDGLVYLFSPTKPSNARPCWRRTDLALELRWTTARGWVVADQAGTVLSRPWDLEPGDQGPFPPIGVWVSRKGDKAYVYDLAYQIRSEP